MTGFLAKGHSSMALLAPCILNLGCKPLSHSLDYTVFFLSSKFMVDMSEVFSKLAVVSFLGGNR